MREAVLAAYAQQDVPFEQVVEAVQPPRDLSRTPLFQVMFAWQNAPLPTAVVGELRLRPVAAEAGTAKFDLTLDLAEAGEEIAGALEYNTDLFERETIARLAGHLQTLLAGAVAGPERPAARVAAVGGGGAAAGAGGVEPDGGGLPAGSLRARVVRAAGGAQPRRRGGGGR